jgi:hypothetical protein
MPHTNEEIDSNLPPDIRPEAFKSLHYTGISEWLHINKWQFLLIIEKAQERSKTPRLEHVAIPLGIFIALLFSLLPVDYKYFLGIDANVWQAVAICLTILSGGMTLVLFCWWLTNCIRYKKQSSNDIFESLIQEMATEKKKLDSISQNKDSE